MERALKIGIGFGLLFAIIAVPFPFVFLPRFNYAHSDSLLMYQVVGASFFLGLICGLFLSAKVNSTKTLTFLQTSLSYVLAFYLFKYGFDKLFLYQFYFPEPNTLHTPLGHLSKDILFWSSMGTSFWYNLFMGIIEVVPSFLLLHRKTRMLGAFVAFGVLLNVWAINFSFDITVKILSSLLLLISLYILSFSLKRLLQFFTDKEVDALSNRKDFFTEKPLTKRIIKGSFIALICIEVFLPQIHRMESERNTVLAGSFDIIDIPDEATIPHDTKRIHFHSKGWLILENENQEFEDYKIQINGTKNSFYLVNEHISMKLNKTDTSTSLSWSKNEETFVCQLEKINLENMEIMKDKVQFVME